MLIDTRKTCTPIAQHSDNACNAPALDRPRRSELQAGFQLGLEYFLGSYLVPTHRLFYQFYTQAICFLSVRSIS